MVGSDLSRATTSLAGTQYQTDTALKGTQLNDATSQAWAAQQQAAQQQGLGAEMGAGTQDLNINASALAGRESQWASATQTHGIRLRQRDASRQLRTRTAPRRTLAPRPRPAAL